MQTKKVLGIPVEGFSYEEILEKIEKYLEKPAGFFHIVSLNPENLVIARQNSLFKKVLYEAKIRIVDGIGVAVASFFLNLYLPPRVTGVDLMVELLNFSNKRRLKVMLLGGRSKIAEKVVNCQKKNFPEVKFFALEGIRNIKNPKKEEEEKIFSIVSRFKPHFLFVAFGSPYQELWLYRHQKRFFGIVCMGVGGAFDYLSNTVVRAPKIIRFLGFEWLFRLFVQPWRLRRQLRLLKFSWLIFLEIVYKIKEKMKFVSRKNFFEVSKELMIDISAGWLGLITAPFILGEFKNYSLILTRGVALFILGVFVSLWLTDQSKKL